MGCPPGLLLYPQVTVELPIPVAPPVFGGSVGSYWRSSTDRAKTCCSWASSALSKSSIDCCCCDCASEGTTACFGLRYCAIGSGCGAFLASGGAIVDPGHLADDD